MRAGYVRRRADDSLFDIVVSGRFAHVLAPDRSGKSSLVAATAARLEAYGCKVAILDLEQIGERDGGSDSGRWYYSVAYRLIRQLRIRYDLQTWWQDKSSLSNRQRLVDFYSEVVLQFVAENIVVFVDQIQCIEDLPYADQLLASIRAAHNARAADPDFTRLTFVLLGECDPVSLIEEATLSPFNVTQQVLLEDFSRADLNVFATEMNMSPDSARRALDRVYYWTNGQPYLSQKLARAISRDVPQDDYEETIDRIARQQLAGRAALHSEPHMSHIHRRIVNDHKCYEQLLNLYGKLRKGLTVPADLGSPLQRRLMAVGLIVIDNNGNLKVRNRVYEAVFTARWANENLPMHLRMAAYAAVGLFIFTLIPFWYTQWLPGAYVRTLTAIDSELDLAHDTYVNFRSFPGHADTSERLYRSFLQRRASISEDIDEVRQLAARVAALPDSGRLAESLIASFWDRTANAAMREEDRDAALLASIEALHLPTPRRRQRAAALIADDYPLLLATLPSLANGKTVFDPASRLLTTAVGEVISQWSYSPQGVQQREPWSVTALEVSPLVRRVIVERAGSVGRIGLTLNVSHARLADLRIKIIAPSGRAVEIELDPEHASSADDLHIPARQLSELAGEELSGTWSISVRDETLGVAGRLVGWNLRLDSQVVVEHFERGLNIPDPIERETDNVWFDASGRYAVARATQSDSARIWDLAFSEPVRAIAVSENETLIGLDVGARHLVTATQDNVNIWDTASGKKVTTLPVGAASTDAFLTRDGTHLVVERRGDVETRLQLWSLADKQIESEVVVAGIPAHVVIDAFGGRVAVADFDRAVRVWDFDSGQLLAQLDLPAQPSQIRLAGDGNALAAVYPDSGVSLWNVDLPGSPILQESGNGDWRLVFSPSSSLLAVGRPETGYQTYSTDDGRVIGPTFGLHSGGHAQDLLSFSEDETVFLTVSRDGVPRIWGVAAPSSVATVAAEGAHTIWNPSADRIVLASPDGSQFAIGDPFGHVHMVSSALGLSEIADIATDVSFLGHNSSVRLLAMSDSGSLVASVANDNSVRIWRTDSGEPLPYVIDVAAALISKLVFSPDARSLAILQENRLSIVDVADGEQLAVFDLGATFNGIAFADDGRIYVGGENGALNLLRKSAGSPWQMQQVWQGRSAIRLLRAAPRGDTLLLVDSNNLASQFDLSEGRLGDNFLQLPASVEDVAFDKTGARVYIRTSRWVHRASLSVSGLHWIDALLAPKSLPGAAIVFGNGSLTSPADNRIYLPAAKNGYIEFVQLDFAAHATTGLFGSKEDLLREWRARVSAVPREAF